MRRKHKYGVATKAARTCNGVTYASKAEMLYHQHLRGAALAIGMEQIETQPTIKFACGVKYRPDFKLTYLGGSVEYVDVKGVETAEFKIKCKLWASECTAPLRIVKLKGSKFVTDRIIKGGSNGKA